MKAEALRFQVSRLGETQIDLTFCASLTENLPRLVPERVRRKLKRRAVDLLQVMEAARARDFAPGELFCVAEGAATFRAWLE
jgi:hypothetical protein